MVVCSEVIEHIKDDHAALREMARILGPGGELILTVPSHAYYFGWDDRFVQHWRRYKITELVKTLSDIGFEDFDIVNVAGPVEKITMIFAVSLFRLVRPMLGVAGKKSKLPAFLKLLLPLYKKANGLFCLLIKAEASIIPHFLATIVLIHCRKSALGPHKPPVSGVSQARSAVRV
jgi:SAM-dependent methyltransferase